MTYFEILQSFHLTVLQWTAICFAVFLLGLAKSGVKGIGIIIVVILAFVFGEKASTGILLPMLICADIFAVVYYNKHAQWHYIKKLLPAMVIGVLVGVWVGNDISEVVFKRIMAVIIIGSVLIMFYMENRKSTTVPTNKWFSNSAGFLAGFTTMVGNLAGPISDIYFLAMRLPKNEFIGTAAWLFFIINVFKLPFHFFVWKTVSVETLVLNSILIPMVILGFFLGAYIVKLISNVNYRRFVLIVTALGGIIMLFR
ncbi:Sulfite exporter TauE/SafE [Mariniflexile rhizosphaerae]|uniref:sulfite exporter TauE/SafE family protein n=1 Tax=unclassified Mariniflexile TaxID=2643887 RepID=UPI000CAFC83C|nr:sulfite exporter TauE/SafE family protein [Mariniflexile sp. TRM1-10]AXP80887.1 Sulfite exporter TauE/SafE [Mariniflexile sp. TRM1-10]PLB17941.1 MAG: putative integral membrane protein [Flavobacteriaceae bacterium FS1-H7996/R]